MSCIYDYDDDELLYIYHYDDDMSCIYIIRVEETHIRLKWMYPSDQVEYVGIYVV